MPIIFDESEISVPWGHIAVKAWGHSCDTPVLVIHGIQDNCGSFDRLIPLLPRVFYFFCIDLPGHGKSSPFPAGIPLNFLQYVYSVKLVIEHLKWKKFVLMGHSLGAQISLFITALYPELIEKIIFIDGLSPVVTKEEDSIRSVRRYFDSLYEQDKKFSSRSPPSYTYEEALKRLIDNRPSKLTDQGARTLIERSLVSSGQGFRYSTDQRLKFRLRPIMTMNQMKQFVLNVKCPALMIIAKDTYDLIDQRVADELYHKRLQDLFLSMPNFRFVLVEGNHDVHLNYPERIESFLKSFLLKPSKSLL